MRTFFPRPKDEAEQTFLHFLDAARGTGKLRGDVVIFHDRTGQELREKEDVIEVIEKRTRGRGGFAIEIDHVSDLLEDDERDAERERDLRHRPCLPATAREERVQVGDGEDGVLRVNEEGEIRGHAERDQHFRVRSAVSDAAAEPPIEKRRGENHEQEDGFAPAVKGETGAEQNPAPARQEPIEREENREEREEKKGRGEKHAATVSAPTRNSLDDGGRRANEFASFRAGRAVLVRFLAPLPMTNEPRAQSLAEISQTIRASALSETGRPLASLPSTSAVSDFHVARIQSALQRARRKTFVRMIKPFRGMFRNQGAVNDSLIEAVQHLSAQNQELIDQVNELRELVASLRSQLRRTPMRDAGEETQSH